MSEFINQTLAQIVNADHRTAAVFEKYNLDFCCKGKRSLKQACDEFELPVQPVVSELQAVTKSGKKASFINFSLSELTAHIEATHHEYVRREMPQLVSYLRKVASKHGNRHPEMLSVFEAFLNLSEELTNHLEKEELVLFPRIKMLELEEVSFRQEYLSSPIEVMEHEHDDAGSLMAEIRRLTNNYTPPADACTTFRLSLASLQAFEMDLHQHVHLENNILFPRALELFGKHRERSLN